MKLNLTWIPELFYDLIGRIGPGAMVLISALAARLGPTNAWKTIIDFFETVPAKGRIDMEWFYLATIALFSYFVGAVLSSLWDWLEGLSRTLSEAKKGGKPVVPPENPKPIDDMEDIGLLTRYVGIKLPAEGIRLTKLFAEENLCKTIITGLVLILALALSSPDEWQIFHRYTMGSAYLVVSMALTMVACRKWMLSLRDQRDKDLFKIRSLLMTGRIKDEANATEKTPEERLMAVLSLKSGPEIGGIAPVPEAALGISK